MTTQSNAYNTTAWISLANSLILSMVLVLPAFAVNDGEKGVRAASAQFYAALNAMFTGDVGPMKDAWSHADDVVYMGPDGGFNTGWKQVLTDWEKQAAMKLGGKVTPQNLRVVAGKEIAIVCDYEKGENKDSKGKVQPVSIRATNVFRLEGGKWKMIAHHTDTLPYLTKP